MTLQMSRRRLFQAAGVSAALAALPLGAGAAFSSDGTDQTLPSLVDGFAVDTQNATVTSLSIDDATQSVVVSLSVPVADVLCDMQPGVRLVKHLPGGDD